MPITPVHLGPTLGLMFVFKRYLDVVVFFVAALVVDLEPILLLLFGVNAPFYFSHSFLSGALIGVVVAYVVHVLRLLSLKFWPYLYPGLSWHPAKEVSLVKLFLSGIVGVWSHLALDLLVSTGVFSLGQVYSFSLIMFLVAMFIGLRSVFSWSLIKREKSEVASTGEELP